MHEKLTQGLVLHLDRPVAGNGALLVMVDSGGAYHNRSIVPETITNALLHFGLPFRWLDLRVQRPTAELLAGCAGLVIAQDGLGWSLTQKDCNLILDAVQAGMGLVNFDWDLRRYPAPFLELFGFEGLERKPIATNMFRVPSNDHAITWLQQPSCFHEARRMVTALTVRRWRAGVTPLLEAVLGKDQLIYIRHLVPENAFVPGHYPVLFGAHWGQGRAVQYTVNPRLWRNGALGHLGGLDDVFWRSILWVVRKPFVACPVPPFLTFSFDDCVGTHAFKYLEICSQYGYIPLVGLFLDDIRPEHLTVLQSLQAVGRILINTHGGRNYYDRIYYEFGIGEYTPQELQAKFDWEDAFYQQSGLVQSRTVRGHFGEIGVQSLPFLKARRRNLICTPILIGEHKADQFPTDGYWPYHSLRCYYQPLPDDNDFYTFGAYDVRHLIDFLTGATTWLRESSTNDLERAAEQAAFQARLGLNNGFFGEILTHEGKLDVLSLENWDHILRRTNQKLSRYAPVFAGHDEIGLYLQNREGVWLEQVDIGDGAIHCTLAGRSESPFWLTCYQDSGDSFQEQRVSIPSFAGHSEVDL